MRRAYVGLVFVFVACFGSRSILTPAQNAIVNVEQESLRQENSTEAVRWLVEEGEALLESFPLEREVFVFLLRHQATAGYARLDTSPVDTFARGKETARACLRLNGAWEVMERLDGGRITIPALRRLEVVDLPCVRQLLFHWLCWVVEQGPAGLVDLRVIESLTDRVFELSQGDETWVEHWALGMIAGLSRQDAETIPKMTLHFGRAQALAEGLSIPTIDHMALLIRHNHAPSRVARELSTWSEKPFQVHDGAQWSLENRASLKRAIDLLGGLRGELPED